MNRKYDNNQYWNERAAGYSKVNLEELNGIQRITWSSLLNNTIRKNYPEEDPENLKILDMGAGPGFLSIVLAELDYAVTAADFSEDMLREARENAEACNADIHLIHQDVENLSLPDEAYHVIISRNLTWNLEYPEQAYLEWMRVQKKDGMMLVFDANWYSYLYSRESLASYVKDRQNVAKSKMDDYNIGTGLKKWKKLPDSFR